MDWNWIDIGKWVRDVSLSVKSLSQLCAMIGKGKRVMSLSSLSCLLFVCSHRFDLFVFCFIECDLLDRLLIAYLFGLFFGLSGLLVIVLIVICKFVLFIYWLDHNLCLSSFFYLFKIDQYWMFDCDWLIV